MKVWQRAIASAFRLIAGHIACLVFVVVPAISTAEHNFADADIDAGRSLYDANCANCHGADLEGQPDWRTPDPEGVLPAPPHDVSGHTWHHETQLLFDYTKLGGQTALEIRGVADFPSGMPAFQGSLSDNEIMDVLAFIRSTWPEEAQAFQTQVSHPE